MIMQMKSSFLLILPALFFLSNVAVQAQTGVAFPFLLENPDVRSNTLGKTVLITADEHETHQLNSYSVHMAIGKKVGHIGYAAAVYPKEDWGRQSVHTLSGVYSFGAHALALSARYQGGTTLTTRNRAGELTEYNPYELVTGLAYCYQPISSLSIHIGADYFNSYIGKVAHGLSLNAGLFYKKEWDTLRESQSKAGVSVGLVAENFGPKAGYEGGSQSYRLPTKISLAPSGYYQFNDRHQVGVAVTPAILLPQGNSAFLFGIGAEYVYQRMIAVRLGYHNALSGSEIALGTGLNWRNARLDVGYLFHTRDEMFSHLLLSLGYSF